MFLFVILHNIPFRKNISHLLEDLFYSCGLSTTTIEYSCPSACLSVFLSWCLCVCLCVCFCVHDNSKNNGSVHFKLEHIVVYENNLDKFNIGHCLIKIKVMA